MFVVSRKREESVIVDGFNSPQRALKVTVLEVKGDRVKLSFEVNADVPALRSQTWTGIHGGFGHDLETASLNVLDA